jgi:hypothetical protein
MGRGKGHEWHQINSYPVCLHIQGITSLPVSLNCFGPNQKEQKQQPQQSSTVADSNSSSQSSLVGHHQMPHGLIGLQQHLAVQRQQQQAAATVAAAAAIKLAQMPTAQTQIGLNSSPAHLMAMMQVKQAKKS